MPLIWIALKAGVMSTCSSQLHDYVLLLRERERESLSRGIEVFMFEDRELCGADRSIRRRFIIITQ